MIKGEKKPNKKNKFCLIVGSVFLISGIMFMFLGKLFISLTNRNTNSSITLNSLIKSSKNNDLNNEDKKNQITLKDLNKKILESETGAKKLSNSVIQKLIFDFYQNFVNYKLPEIKQKTNDKNTTGTTKPQNAIEKIVHQHWNESYQIVDNKFKEIVKENKKTIVLKDFDNDERKYKNFNQGKILVTKFSSLLTTTNYLSYDNKTNASAEELKKPENWSKIKFENSNGNPLEQSISKFQEFLFNDWYKYRKPLPILKFTWKYSDFNFQKADSKILEQIYNSSKIALPEKPNYFFPVFDDQKADSSSGKTKFELFASEISNIYDKSKQLINVKNFTDDPSKLSEVITLNNFDNSSTSQHYAAVLMLKNSLSKNFRWFKNDVNISELKKPLINIFAKKENNTSNNNFKKNKTGIQISSELFATPSTSSLNAKKTEPDFKKINQVHDFVVIKENKTNSIKQKNNWLLFKDEIGAHAISIYNFQHLEDTKVSNTQQNTKKNTDTAKDKKIKEIIYAQAMTHKSNISDENGIKFDLFKELKDYLNYEFNSIFLRFLKDNFSTKDSTKLALVFPNTTTDVAPSSLSTSTVVASKISEKTTNVVGTVKEKKVEATIQNTNKFDSYLSVNSKTLFSFSSNPFWQSNESAICRINSSNKLKDLLIKLEEFLTSLQAKDILFKIRKSLIHSYSHVFNGINETKDGKYYSALNNGLGGKIPYAIKTSESAEPTSYTKWSADNDGGYKELEKFIVDNSSIYKPGTIKTKYDAYKQALTTYFNDSTVKILLGMENNSKAEYSDHAGEDIDTLKIQKIDPTVFLIFSNLIKEQNLYNEYLKNQSFTTTVKEYFDWTNNDFKKEIKISNVTEFDSTNTAITKESTPSKKDVTKEFKFAFLSNYLKERLNFEETKIIFGGFKYEKEKLIENLTKWFMKIFEQDNSVFSSNSFDLFSEFQKNFNQKIITIDWLMKDNFKNLKSYLNEQLKTKNNLAFFFSNSPTIIESEFGKNKLSKEKNDFEFISNFNGQLKSPFFFEEGFEKNKKTNPNNWNISKIKIPVSSSASSSQGETTSTNIYLTGFNGLISWDSNEKNKLETKLIANSISDKKLSSIGGTINSFVKEVKAITTFNQFKKLFNLLKNQFPEINWSNAERTEITNPVTNKNISLSLQQRINALINIIYGYQYTYNTDGINVFNDSVKTIYNSVQSSSNSCNSTFYSNEECNISGNYVQIKNKSFESVFDQLEGKDKEKKYLIQDTTNSKEYVAYMIQINNQDIVNEEKFKALKQKLTIDLFLSLIMQVSDVRSVKEAAMFDHWSNIQKFETTDQKFENSEVLTVIKPAKK